MKWDNIRDWNKFRENGARNATNFWITANAALVSKNFLDNKDDISAVLENPYDLIAGLIFFGATYYSRKNTNKDVAIGMAIATIGYSVLLGTALANQEWKSSLGALSGLGACAWGCHKSLKEMREEKVKTFKENKKSIEEYPLLKPMAVEFLANLAFITGYALQGETTTLPIVGDIPFYPIIGTLWALGSSCMGVSKQKQNTTNANPAPS